MYLKSLKICNYRKFGTIDSKIEFIDSKINSEINISNSTTLIVGQNNTGKTTITNALESIKDSHFVAYDFNFKHLHSLLQEYKAKNFTNKPYLYFELTVGFSFDENDYRVNNFIPFINISDIEANKKEITIIIKREVEDEKEFEKHIENLIDKFEQLPKDNKNTINNNERWLFKKFLDILENKNKIKFAIKYYNPSNYPNEPIDKTKFAIKNLIDVVTIKANKNISNTSLSETFSKIIRFKYDLKEDDNIETLIKDINDKVTDNISAINNDTNNVLNDISKKFSVLLTSDITYDHMMTKLIKYEYIESNLNIPEGQFGLGYTNMVSILGTIIDYIEKYPSENKHNKVNLICIEEPEAFMHPQMQEIFMRYINDTIKKILDNQTKKINSQLIVTTHSSHILNSKIHESNSFDNINYLVAENGYSTTVSLNDIKITDDEDKEKKLKFIKKHIKNKVSELFFADGAIFVEGITEDTLIKEYIDNDNVLNKKYITIFNIDGAHGLVYHNLIKILKIPTVIITDLDIKKVDGDIIDITSNPESKKKKYEYSQRTKIDDRTTTNKTIIKYIGENLKNLSAPITIENMYITCQYEPIEGYYATSFEEAFILTNYKNDILNKVLKALKSNIYSKIVGELEDVEKIKNNSFKLQNKLSTSKSEFANTLLYEYASNDNSDNIPKLPKYILDSLEWLKSKLKSGE